LCADLEGLPSYVSNEHQLLVAVDEAKKALREGKLVDHETVKAAFERIIKRGNKRMLLDRGFGIDCRPLYRHLPIIKSGGKVKIDFSGFEWDHGNIRKCQKHGVSIFEIEHVLAHAESLIIADTKNSKAEQRYLAIGRTLAGRYTCVVFTPRVRMGELLLRPISARYMHLKEVEKYEQEIAGLQNR
jgi:uncharacterized DUF497 family protein